jgi:hypothetical protein
MTEVTAALCAGHFDSTHAERRVLVLGDLGLIQSLIKGWPSASGVKLGFAREENLIATRAPIDSVSFVIPILACEGSFCTFLSQNVKLLGSKNAPPLLLILRKLIRRMLVHA